jgi:hypothetical protein
MRVRRAGRAFAVYDAGGGLVFWQGGPLYLPARRSSDASAAPNMPILAEYAMTIEKKLDIGIPRAIDVGQNVKRIEAYQV